MSTKLYRNCLISLFGLFFVLPAVAAVADSAAVAQCAINIDCASNAGAVTPFAWGVVAPDKYTWWAGNTALEARIRDAHIKLVRVNPIQIAMNNGRDPYPSPGQTQFAELDSILTTIFDSGAEPLFVVAGFPKGIAVSKDANGYLSSVDWAEYARFMGQLVHRYNVEHVLGAGRSVRYWEMWNEPSIEGDGKFATKDAYKAFVEVVGGAMKKEDPAIQLVGPAAPWSDLGADGWVAYTAQNLSGLIDILSWHDYGPGPGHDDGTVLGWTDKNYEDDVLAVNSGGDKNIFVSPSGKPIKTAITEYNISWQNGDDSYNEKYHSQLNAVFAASSIVHAIRGKVTMFCFYNLAETGKNLLGLLSNTDYSPYKPYYVFSLFGNHFGDQLLNATGSSPNLESVAARQSGSGKYSVVLVNKDLDKACDVVLNFGHMRSSHGVVRITQIDASSSVPVTITQKYSESTFHYRLQPQAIVSVEIL